jgi:hypothetical protein
MAMLPKTMLVAIFFIAVSFTISPDGASPLLLNKAIKDGFVKSDVKSLGGYSGDCLTLTLKNLKSVPISILIPSGTIFEAADPEVQNLIVVKERLIVLKSNESKSTVLIGFCSNAPKKSPPVGIVYKPIDSASQNLKKISEYLNKSEFSEHAVQSAIWCVTDGNYLSEVYDENPEKSKDLRTEISKITGQPLVWYNTHTDRTISQNGYINNLPVSVSGEISIKITEGGKLIQEVINKEGKVMYKAKDMEISSAGNITYNFQLTVEGWEKGKYFVKASLNGKVLLKQEFAI